MVYRQENFKNAGVQLYKSGLHSKSHFGVVGGICLMKLEIHLPDEEKSPSLESFNVVKQGSQTNISKTHEKGLLNACAVMYAYLGW